MFRQCMVFSIFLSRFRNLRIFPVGGSMNRHPLTGPVSGCEGGWEPIPHDQLGHGKCGPQPPSHPLTKLALAPQDGPTAVAPADRAGQQTWDIFVRLRSLAWGLIFPDIS